MPPIAFSQGDQLIITNAYDNFFVGEIWTVAGPCGTNVTAHLTERAEGSLYPMGQSATITTKSEYVAKVTRKMRQDIYAKKLKYYEDQLERTKKINESLANYETDEEESAASVLTSLGMECTPDAIKRLAKKMMDEKISFTRA